MYGWVCLRTRRQSAQPLSRGLLELTAAGHPNAPGRSPPLKSARVNLTRNRVPVSGFNRRHRAQSQRNTATHEPVVLGMCTDPSAVIVADANREPILTDLQPAEMERRMTWVAAPHRTSLCRWPALDQPLPGFALRLPEQEVQPACDGILVHLLVRTGLLAMARGEAEAAVRGGRARSPGIARALLE